METPKIQRHTKTLAADGESELKAQVKEESGGSGALRDLTPVAALELPRAIRTVKLELLRHGPAHNHLLSPLTPYLALCGNHDAETVRVGVEHLDLLVRIQQLRYEMGPAMAAVALREASDEVTRLLESIHSLTAELSSSDPEEGKRKIHLRIVLSASELALLPFELAKAYTGLQGHGQFMSLQTVSPVCMTREARRVAAATFKWPDKVRILVISAAPPPMAAVPLREHMRAIQQALLPYMVHRPENKEFAQEFDRHVTVIPEASVASIYQVIARACSDGSIPYTHVHVLAHGFAAEGSVGEAPRYGLAFHDSENPHKLDIVTGERLAAALLPLNAQYEKHSRSKPVLLTIASCDSANQGHVIAPGASIAHELHEHGIPLVIGSQFPLSVRGSVIMAEEIFTQLFRGMDPRDTIILLRKKLRALLPDSVHDWASLVVYAALPTDLEAQLARFRFKQAREMLGAAMSRIDNYLESAWGRQGIRSDYTTRLHDLRHELVAAMRQLKDAVPPEGSGLELVSALGVLASASKQVAGMIKLLIDSLRGAGRTTRKAAPKEVDADLRPASLKKERFDYLEEAQQYYRACYQQGGARDSWALVQYLSLTVLVKPGEVNGAEFKERWTAAVVMSRDALNESDPQRRIWALSSLIELMILSVAWVDRRECERQALQYVKQLLDIVSLDPDGYGFDAYSFYRQLRRYELWKWGTKDMVVVSRRLRKHMDRSGVANYWTRA